MAKSQQATTETTFHENLKALIIRLCVNIVTNGISIKLAGSTYILALQSRVDFLSAYLLLPLCVSPHFVRDAGVDVHHL